MRPYQHLFRVVFRGSAIRHQDSCRTGRRLHPLPPRPPQALLGAACLGIALCLTGGTTALGAAAGPDQPAVTRTQTIQLVQGWNAVFLEVDPADPDPAVVFAGTPVEQAAGFATRTTSAQFVSDPGANLFRRAGWGVWYAANRPDAFLRTLHAIHGQQAYLIRSQEAFTWNVTGNVISDEVRWQPDAFNLVGFSVASPGAPTFAQFFAGSAAHTHDRIYRLEGGNWRRVTDPAGENLRSGEAFWIYCRGASTYQGPLAVTTLIGQQLLLGSAPQDVVFRNATGHPITPTLEHVPVTDTPVPMSVVIQAVVSDIHIRDVAAPKPTEHWVQTLPPLEAGAAIRLPLEARREEMRQARQVSLLKVSTDLGTETWLPVAAIRKDLEEQ